MTGPELYRQIQIDTRSRRDLVLIEHGVTPPFDYDVPLPDPSETTYLHCQPWQLEPYVVNLEPDQDYLVYPDGTILPVYGPAV
mgnify:CR=1 FL=1